MRLFCFPYAGGSGSIFRAWRDAFPATVDVCPVQIPGRGLRIREPLMKRVDAVVSALMQELRPYMDRPFVFFGHSMGAVIAFELARSMRNDLRPQPLQLFLSARRAPDVPADGEERDYLLPDAALVARLQSLNGTPQEILDNPEALELLLPLVRADFEIVQTYEYRPQLPLRVAIDAFAGSEDSKTPPEAMEGWKAQTTGEFSLTVVPGGHFFLHDTRKEFLGLLAAKVSRLLERVHAGPTFSIR